MNNSSKIDRVFADATDFEISSAAHSVFEKIYGFEAIQECVSRYLRRHRESYSDVIDQIEQAITEHRRMFESHV